MEPGVPFALLGAVQLLLVVACAGLAAAGWLRRSLPGALVAMGALLLAAVEVRVALRLGSATSDDLALARAAGALVLGAGLYLGGLKPRAVSIPVLGVVVPLAAAGAPAAFAAVTTALAAGAAVLNRRDAIGAWLGGGLSLWAVAAGLAPFADQGPGGAETLVVCRGLGALAVVVGLVLLAQVSLLSKVVSAILAGVVTMAVAAVGVVGNVVVDSYDRQSRETVQNAADDRLTALRNLGQQTEGIAQLAARVCPTADCSPFLRLFVPANEGDFLVRVTRGQTPVSLAGRLPLTPSELLGLRGLPVVHDVLEGVGPKRLDSDADNARLTGAKPTLAVVGVAADLSSRPTPAAAPTSVYLYGVRVDTRYTQRDLDIGGFKLSFLAGDPQAVIASNGSEHLQAQLLRIVRDLGAAKGLPAAGRTIGSQGANPTVVLRSVQNHDGDTIALLAMTRDAGPALRTERDALRLLLITALAALAIVAVVAVLLGRRTVDPVRRLTAAAERVAGGDLTTVVGASTKDEVGTLSHRFDAMTASLAGLTGDLRASAARLETVLASMTDGLLATDADGVVTSVNRAALAMLGVDEADVLGESLELVADVRDANGTSMVALSAVRLDEPGEVLRPDGTKVPVRVALTPLTDAEGVVLVLRDTTREREVERMKTEFLSNVSHELRTPLTPIRGYAEILVSKPGLDTDKVTSFAATIRDESLKMNRVVDLLVDVAALEAGRVHATPRTVPVRDLLDARVTAWQKRARGREVKRRVAARLPDVHVDPLWLAKALDELIDNAVKYAPTGVITLVGAMAPDGDRVRVSVRDAGPGLSPEEQSRMFTSFEQVDGSATRRVGGLGLGLSFVRRLAEDAGFPFTVQSAKGRGSEFSLDLPRA